MLCRNKPCCQFTALGRYGRARMEALFPDEFGFAPKTFALPIELNDFLDQFKVEPTPLPLHTVHTCVGTAYGVCNQRLKI